MAAAMSLGVFGVVAAFAVAPTQPAGDVDQRLVVESLELIASATPADEPGVFVREERIQRGDTVGELFNRLGIADRASLDALRMRPDAARLFRELRPGKTVVARTNSSGELLSLMFPLNAKDRSLIVERDQGELRVAEQVAALDSRLVIKSGEIQSSLFGAADAIGLPDTIAIQIAEIFAGDIDFHRDLRRGDRFSVVYETLYQQGTAIGTGRVVAAEFVNQDKVLRAVYFQDSDGEGGYYAPDGKSLRKAFLRSPLEFSRVTSGFSMRYHPVLQEWRAHRGVDYGAPIGTRVRATGDGVVDFAGRQGGYGNVVILRHAGRYTTVYGHLNGFAPNVRKGARVSQGDNIGFVGKTGLATGPHLHYEFRVDNVHKNPLTVALPHAQPIGPARLQAFRFHAEPLVARLDLVRVGNLALLD